MLTVVEDKQQSAFPDVRAERLCERPDWLLVHAEDLRSRARNQQRIPDRCQVDEPDTVRIFLQHVCTDLQRQSVLAQSTHAQEREQARVLEQGFRLGELSLAT